MLFASKKIQTVGTISDFMSKEKKVEIQVDVGASNTKFLYPISLPFILTPAFFDGFAAPTFAAGTGAAVETMGKAEVSNKIISAFAPITDLVQGLAYPITFISLSYAGILFIMRRNEQAIQTLQGAAIGFIIVNMAPLLMRLLVSITAGF